MREASNAAAEPRRSITASRTSVRPLQVIHTGAPRLIKSLGVLAPPDPRRLIFFNLHKVEEGQDSLALLVCTPRGNTKIILFLRTFLRNFSPRISELQRKFSACSGSELFRVSEEICVTEEGHPRAPFIALFHRHTQGIFPIPCSHWRLVETLFTLAPGSKPCSHWRLDQNPVHTGTLIQGIFLGFCAQYRGPCPTFGSPLI